MSNREAEISLRFEMKERGIAERRIAIAKMHYAIYASRDRVADKLPWMPHYVRWVQSVVFSDLPERLVNVFGKDVRLH